MIISNRRKKKCRPQYSDKPSFVQYNFSNIMIYLSDVALKFKDTQYDYITLNSCIAFLFETFFLYFF